MKEGNWDIIILYHNTLSIPHSKNYRKTGASEGLQDRLDRQMEIAPINKCISQQSVGQEILFFR